MKLVRIDPEQIEKAWPLIEAWVAEAVEKAQSDQSPQEIKWHLQRGEMQLFLVWDGKDCPACCILEFTRTARGNMCNIYLCAGRGYREWRHLMEDVKAIARDKRCTLLQAAGRPGWERALAPDGFKKLRVILETRLE